MKKILVIIDVQKDFYHPEGALYVKGGELLPKKISNIISKFDDVIFTMDWHPYNHCSFKDNGGIWTRHCVGFSEGASLPQEFMPYFKYNHKYTNNVFVKGVFENVEEYAINPLKIMHNHKPTDEFVFCGIAGDFCVLESIIKFKNQFPKTTISVYLDGTVSIDNGEKLKQYMGKHNIKEFLI
jgi:nicotinamidase/pyrazinamidase